MQRVIPRFILAHLGSGLLQSQQMSLPGILANWSQILKENAKQNIYINSPLEFHYLKTK